MTIIRTITAKCDRPGCQETLEINPNDLQPFLTASDAGWDVQYDYEARDMATICPRDHDAACTSLLDLDGDWWIEYEPDRFYVATAGGVVMSSVEIGEPSGGVGGVDLVHLFAYGVSSEPR